MNIGNVQIIPRKSKMVRQKKKLCEIRIYEFNVDKRFYRAECKGISVPSRTIKGAVNNLLKDLKDLGWI